MSTVSTPESSSADDASNDHRGHALDFNMPDFARPIEYSGTDREKTVRTRYDYATTTVPWATEGMFAGKVKVAEWRGFEQAAGRVRELLQQCDPGMLQRAKGLWDSYKSEILNELPSGEEHLRDSFSDFRIGLRTILRALHSDEQNCNIVTGWSAPFEFYTTLLSRHNFETQEIEYRVAPRPDFVLIDERTRDLATNLYFPIATVELKGPRHPITSSEIHMDAFYASGDHFGDEEVQEGKQFVQLFQTYLDCGQDWGGVGLVHTQAMVEALHSYTGYAVLFFHSWARAMRVTGVERGKIKVEVSRAFACMERTPASLCLTTALHLALKKMKVKARDCVREDFQSLFTLSKCSLLVGGALPRQSNPPPAQNQNQDDGSAQQNMGQESTAVREQNGWLHPLSLAPVNTHGDYQIGRVIQRWTTKWVPRVSELLWKRSIPLLHKMHGSEWDARVQDILGMCRTWDKDTVASAAYKSSFSLLGTGKCGIVKNTLVEGVHAAVKFWNETEKAHENLLYNEIAMLCFLSHTNPKVMGTAVPRLIAVGMHNWVGTVLVTERVGESIKWSREALYVGTRILTRSELTVVRAAAVTSLKMLQACFCRHGDVSLRNLRVAAVAQKYSELGCVWLAWWIDFGLSSIEKDKALLDREIKICESLFGVSPRTLRTARFL